MFRWFITHFLCYSPFNSLALIYILSATYFLIFLLTHILMNQLTFLLIPHLAHILKHLLTQLIGPHMTFPLKLSATQVSIHNARLILISHVTLMFMHWITVPHIGGDTFSYILWFASWSRAHAGLTGWLIICRGHFGPSGVHALPLAVTAERSVHYIWYYFSFLLFFFRHILFSQKGLS